MKLFAHLLLLSSLLGVAGCVHRPPAARAERTFTYGRDTFAFANETVWKYEDGRHVPGRNGAPEGYHYTHHCFVMCRAALEFWKFAKFDSSQPPPDDAGLAKLIRAVTAHRVASAPLPDEQRVVIPGFASLHDLSARKPRLMQEVIGPCWVTYIRPGNFFIVMPPGRSHQVRAKNYLTACLEQNSPAAVWMYNFPNVNMNHCVIIYAQRQEGTRTIFTIYDPNSLDGPRELTFDATTRHFTLGHTFYFTGGLVHVRPTYVNLLE